MQNLATSICRKYVTHSRIFKCLIIEVGAFNTKFRQKLMLCYTTAMSEQIGYQDIHHIMYLHTLYVTRHL